MKNKLIYAGVAMSLLVVVAPAFAASGAVLSHAGVGQKAGDVTTFGIAVCNNGDQQISQSVPISARANGRTVSTYVNGPLNAGACAYSYLSYDMFGMVGGQTYSVLVDIDPQHSITQSVEPQAAYSVAVPSGQVLGASTVSGDERSQMLAQLASMVAILQQLLAQLAGR
jgi:hypothetical protein